MRFANVLGIRFLLDVDAACADKLKAAMLQYAAYDKWIGSVNLRKSPPWHSELNTARFLYGFALGYDCIKTRLTPQERTYLAQRCLYLGIQPTLDDWLLPGRRVHALDSMGHNWWPVCICAAGLAAVAFRDELPHADTMIRLVDEGLESFFAYQGFPLQNKPANFDPQGAMYEGAIYLAYATGEILTYRLARDRAFAPANAAYDRLFPGMFEYLNHATYRLQDDVINVPMGDCNPHESMIRAFRLGVLCGYDLPHVRWYMQCKGGPHDLWWALAGEKPGLPPTATTAWYPTTGMAFLRDSWQPNSRLMCVKCGDTWNHAHADAGSFMLYDNGVAILQDSGSCSYARDEYPLYYCQSEAHNVLLFNGHGQEAEDHYWGLHQPGRLLTCKDGWLRYVLADATGPMSRYLKRSLRSFILLDDGLILIDDLASYEPGTASALFHHSGDAVLDGLTAHLQGSAAPYRIQALYPKNAWFDQVIGHEDHQPDVPTAYLRLHAPMTARSYNLLPEGDPNSLSANRPVCLQKLITYIGCGNVTCCESQDALIITSGDVRIALNLNADTRCMHVNSHASLLGWRTDAYLLALRGQDYFMVGGSYLQQEDTIAFHALQKETVFGHFHLSP